MKDRSYLWKEIDDAVVAGFVSRMEEIMKDIPSKPYRIYGTRVWFRNLLTKETYEKVVFYINEKYQVKVEQPFSFCIVIWHDGE